MQAFSKPFFIEFETLDFGDYKELVQICFFVEFRGWRIGKVVLAINYAKMMPNEKELRFNKRHCFLFVSMAIYIQSFNFGNQRSF